MWLTARYSNYSNTERLRFRRVLDIFGGGDGDCQEEDLFSGCGHIFEFLIDRVQHGSET